MTFPAYSREPRRSASGTAGDVVDITLRTRRGSLAGDPLTERSRRVWSAGDYDRISAGFRDVFFLDAATGWVAGPSIYKTTDGGTNWTKQLGDGNTEFAAISFADTQNGWATGFNNLVLHTTDGGQSWIAQNVGAPPVTAITGVSAISSTTAWVAGWNGFVARTSDSGQTWRKETIAGASDVDFEDALFLDANTGWVGGNIGIWQRR